MKFLRHKSFEGANLTAEKCKLSHSQQYGFDQTMENITDYVF